MCRLSFLFAFRVMAVTDNVGVFFMVILFERSKIET